MNTGLMDWDTYAKGDKLAKTIEEIVHPGWMGVDGIGAVGYIIFWWAVFWVPLGIASQLTTGILSDILGACALATFFLFNWWQLSRRIKESRAYVCTQEAPIWEFWK
jgi:hypothetical protein